MMSLRFSNSIFEPLRNRNNVYSIELIFKENLGVDVRIGYFYSSFETSYKTIYYKL